MHHPRQFLFLLGRPGCGKSHVFQQVKALLPGTPTRIDDFPKLQDLAKSDDAEEAAGRPRQFTKKTAGSGWLATQVAYETVLRQVDSELRALSQEAGFVFVELARWDMVRSIEDNFSKDVLDRAFLIYVYCPLSICIERNRRRSAGGQTNIDNHEVPIDRLTLRYCDDDHDLLNRLNVPYILIDNHLDGTEHLGFEAQKIVQALGVSV